MVADHDGNLIGLRGRAVAGAVTPRMMKDVLGHFGTGVTVVAAMTDDGPLGFTCQTFVSLSLEPPLVSFCPSRQSVTWSRLRHLDRFTVNILADQHGWLSENFARPGLGGVDKFEGVGYRSTQDGGLVLDDVIAWVECRRRAEYDGGDHTIVVADVLDLDATPDRHPLLYFRGDYLKRHQ